MVAGAFYTLKHSATNSIGEGEMSEELYVATADFPDTPIAPTFDENKSSRYEIVIDWTEGTSSNIPVTGYKLYSDMGEPGNEYLIYDGTGVT